MKMPGLYVSVVLLLTIPLQVIGQTTATAPALAEMIVNGREEGTLERIEGKNLVLDFHAPPGMTYSRPPAMMEGYVVTDEKTRFNVDAQWAKLEDLKPGMRLALERRPPSNQLIILGQNKSRNGTLVKIDGKNLVLHVASARGAPTDTTVETDDTTTVLFLAQMVDGKMVPGGEKTVADLEAGMRLQVVPETGMATRIVASRALYNDWASTPQPRVNLHGTFVAMKGQTMIMMPDATPGAEAQAGKTESEEKQFLIENGGIVYIDSERGTLKDLEAGMSVTLRTLPGGPDRYSVSAQSKGLGGTIAGISGNELLVMKADGKPVTVQTNQDTIFFIMAQIVDGKQIEGGRFSIAELKLGLPVKVIPETGVARKIVTQWAPSSAATQKAP